MEKVTKYLIGVIMCIVVCVFTTPGYADTETDKTLSPYFLVKSDDSEVDQLPLLLTSAEVNIAGVIADVTVTQIYKNEGTRPLEPRRSVRDEDDDRRPDDFCADSRTPTSPKTI
jgi:hypothetical protein